MRRLTSNPSSLSEDPSGGEIRPGGFEPDTAPPVEKRFSDDAQEDEGKLVFSYQDRPGKLQPRAHQRLAPTRGRHGSQLPEKVIPSRVSACVHSVHKVHTVTARFPKRVALGKKVLDSNAT